MPLRKADLVPDSLEPLVLVIRNHRVILDSDLARLYGVTTKAFNQAVKRNAERFPKDFAFQLTAMEMSQLRSQTATSSSQVTGMAQIIQNSSQIVTSSNRSQSVTGSQKHRDPRFRPWAFTEHGAVMAANILHSERAVQMSVFVVRAFVRLREHIAANRTILKPLAEIDKTLLEHDTALVDLYEKLQPLLQPPPEDPNDGSASSRRGKPEGICFAIRPKLESRQKRAESNRRLVKEAVEKTYAAEREATNLLEQAKRRVEELIEQNGAA